MKRAFTLIELLVVVAIIVALIAILLPSMNRALDVTNRAVCASNQHQIGTAAISHAADHRGLLPPREGPNVSGVPHHLFAGYGPTSGDTDRTLLQSWVGYIGGFSATPGEEELTPIWYCPSQPNQNGSAAYEANKKNQYPINNFLIGYEYYGGWSNPKGALWVATRPPPRRITAAGQTPITTDLAADVTAVFGNFTKNHQSPTATGATDPPEGMFVGRLGGGVDWVEYDAGDFELAVTWPWYPPNNGIVWPIN